MPEITTCTYTKLIEGQGRLTCCDPAVVRVKQPVPLPDELLCERHAPALCSTEGCERSRTPHTPWCSEHLITNDTTEYLTPKETVTMDTKTFDPIAWGFKPTPFDRQTCRDLAHCFANQTTATQAKSDEGPCYALLPDADDPQMGTKLSVVWYHPTDGPLAGKTFAFVIASEVENVRPRTARNNREVVTGVWIDRVAAWYYKLDGKGDSRQERRDDAIVNGVRLIESIKASFRNFGDLSELGDDLGAMDDEAAAELLSDGAAAL